MKNKKRILALAGVIIVIIGAILPFIFSFGKSENAAAMFRASVAIAFFLPILMFAMLFVAQMLQKKNGKDMSKKAIDTVIFDVGNVLIGFDWKKYLEQFHFPEEEREILAKVIFQSDHWNLRDRGTVSDQKVLQKMIADAPEYEEDIRRVFRDSYKSVSGKDYAETWVKYLKDQGYRLYILSNYGSGLLAQTRHLIPTKWMDGIIFSCDVHTIKPEPEIYQILLERYGIKPEKAVFLDDRQENLDEAAAFGIHTILFQDFKQAAHDLEKLGIR